MADQQSEKSATIKHPTIYPWIAMLAMAIAIAGATASLLSTVYQTSEEAAGQEKVFIQHVGDFHTHVAHAKAREDILDGLKIEMNEQRKLLRIVNENQIRLMERLSVQPVRTHE